MPTRFRKSLRPWIYRYLSLRDGNHCAICGFVTCPNSKKGTSHYLDIDHVDGNKKNNNVDNLRLLCRRCNVREQHRVHDDRPEGMCVSKAVRSAKIQTIVNYSDGTPEMQVAALAETEFRAWVFQVVEKEGFILKSDAITAGAEMVGVSVATVSRYLSKMTSIAGDYREEKDLTGKVVIVPR